jgi:hypothetical protein
MCIVVTDFSNDSLVTVVVILITKFTSDVWHQGHQFSVVIMIISGTKVINIFGNYGLSLVLRLSVFMVILVIFCTKVISFLW